MGGIAVYRDDDDEENRLRLLGSSISPYIFYIFLQYRPYSGDDNIVEGSIFQIAPFS